MRLESIETGDAEKNGSYYWVGGELTMHTMPCIRRELLHKLNCCKEVKVDFTEVRVVDTIGVGAILAMRHEASQKDQTLHFISCNEAFLKLLNLMYCADFGSDLEN